MPPPSDRLALPADPQHLRDVLGMIGYRAANVQKLLALPDIPSLRSRQQMLPLLLHRTRDASALSLLTRLFLLGQSVPQHALRHSLGDTQIKALEDTDLLASLGDRFTSRLELLPYRNWVLAADWACPESEVSEPVMPLAGSTRSLLSTMITCPDGRTLDLGTGCGALALQAATGMAAKSASVMATDANPRALAMARFNASLNDVHGIDFAEGSWFDPVAGQHFDRILCNPPYLIAPQKGVAHSFSGLEGDELCRSLAVQAPAYLAAGGYFQMLCNWAQLRDGDWEARLASWFEGSGCDTWVLHSHSEEAPDYAWARIGEVASTHEPDESRFNRWMQFYESRGIEAIGFGLVTMRRRDGGVNRFRCDPMPTVVGDCGDTIEEGFQRHDFLETHADDHLLLDARLRRADSLLWEQTRVPGRLGWLLQDSSMSLSRGLAYSGKVDDSIANFLVRCDGSTRLRTHLERLARDAKRPFGDLAPAFLALVRQMIDVGCLVPQQRPTPPGAPVEVRA